MRSKPTSAIRLADDDRRAPSFPADMHQHPVPASGSPGIDLWTTWACPHGMRVRSAIAEKGIPHRSRVIAPGEKLDQSGGTSVLMTIDGGVVSDPLPILEFLESRWPEPPLFPARLGVAAVTGSLARVDATFVPELLRIARGTAVERVDALGKTRTGMGILDGEIPESHYLLGEFSAADLALASVIACLPRDWRPVQLGFHKLARWERAVMSRPAVREQMGPVAC